MNTMIPKMQFVSHSRGFTLIETLVALLVISTGILAFALLQVESLKATHTSMQRTKAIHFATDIIERMRANKAAVSAGQYNASTAAPGANAPFNCSDADGTDAIDCNAFQLASFDVWEWKTALSDTTASKSGIVNGLASINNTDTVSPYNVTITITWNDQERNSSYVLDTVIF
ncbi:MAG: type IV pilus modification protein PilV [Gammaproteobacteria bacterium]|nr:type IV pilus modification protein PilV [Gammaproteobacteria bacterium]NNC97664.1 type IV pilus modification protein PilV [Gammaproteobacteria bacterium]NNM12840.1 type IV pilus modification protein PilV [Gammaproteobacteria bacterium]